MDLAPKVTQSHMTYCFNTILNCLKTKSRSILPYPTDLEDFKLPLFVTWSFTKDDSLRGCIGIWFDYISNTIGTFSKDKLSINLGKFAYTSAFEDSRFQPITLKEIPQLSVRQRKIIIIRSQFLCCLHLRVERASMIGQLEHMELK